jgi:hypothetical protein
MSTSTFLTAEEVVERYRGQLSIGTLANWRVKRIGPDFVKIGKAVLYPLGSLEAWDAQNRVACRRLKGHERAAALEAFRRPPEARPPPSPSCSPGSEPSAEAAQA